MNGWRVPVCALPPEAGRRPDRAMPVPAHVWVLGGSAPGLALRCARAGLAVTVVEPDPDDAVRLADMVARAGGGVSVTAGFDRAPPEALVLVAPGWSGAAPPGALRIGAGFTVTGDVVELSGASTLALGLAQALGLWPVETAGGGVAEPLARAMDQVAGALVLEGAEPWALDDALQETGFAQGVFDRQDNEGVDAALARMGDDTAPHGANGEAGLVMTRMVAEGRLGRKAGVGWYRYPGGGGRVVDPLIEDLVREEAWFLERRQRAVGADECVARLCAALMQVARGLAARGIAASVIDRVAVSGLGYPAQWGGPLHHLRGADPKEIGAWLERSGTRSAG